METSQAARQYYARLVSGIGGVQNERVTSAFATVPREKFVGPGPWTVFMFGAGYHETPSDDPAYLYQDVLIGLSSGQGINNGSPGLHARCLDALAPREGETVVHVGAGTGYYTALLSALVGPTGKVTAYEIDPAIARKAAANLAETANVSLENVSGVTTALPPCDVLYVNAGATHPPAAWLDALRPGGRLLFPLTPDRGHGGMLLVTRGTADTYAARFVCHAQFIPCDGARTPEMAGRVADAFHQQSLWAVRSLRRASTPDQSSALDQSSKPDQSCWLLGYDWWLSTRP